MREPKYQLNVRDMRRYRELVLRECASISPKASIRRVYPPLTLKEQRELQRLEAEKQRRMYRHPRLRASLRRQRHCHQQMQRLLRKIKRLTARVKK